MRMRTTVLLLAGSIGLVFAGSSVALAAPCGVYGGYDSPSAPEQVIVTAPPARIVTGPSQIQHYRLNVPPQKVSMSQPVQYADLDLCTANGAQALRARVRIAANNVCKQLEGMYPYPMQGSPSCYREALNDGMLQADRVVGTARGLR